MPIKKRPAATKRTAKRRQNQKEQLENLAIQLADYRNRLIDALSLLDGANCFRDLHCQIAEVAEYLDESAVCFSDYFEGHIDQEGLLVSLKIYGEEELPFYLESLGSPNSLADEGDLDWTIEDLEEDPVADSTPHREVYPPGVANSVLDQEPDDCDEVEDMGGFTCHAKLVALKKDVALISERLASQLKVGGFKLHDKFKRLWG